jgi:hydroxymethylbilane synthase
MTIIKMGTRGSKLAMAQSSWVARNIEKIHHGVKVETVVIKTSGDFLGGREGASLAPAGMKGLFVKEIEESLLAGTIDFAVHSAKDLPEALAPGLSVAAFPEREDPRDAWIGRGGLPWAELPASATVATASLRRRIQLRAAKPGLQAVSIRGNVDTRLKKLEEGAADGLILALAGLRRLGLAAVKAEPLSLDWCVPSPGQGALAVEVRSDRADAAAIVSRLDHAATRAEVELERGLARAFGGGCQTPFGALSRTEPGGMSVRIFHARPDGSRWVRWSGRCGAQEPPQAFAAGLAKQLSL